MKNSGRGKRKKGPGKERASIIQGKTDHYKTYGINAAGTQNCIYLGKATNGLHDNLRERRDDSRR